MGVEYDVTVLVRMSGSLRDRLKLASGSGGMGSFVRAAIEARLDGSVAPPVPVGGAACEMTADPEPSRVAPPAPRAGPASDRGRLLEVVLSALRKGPKDERMVAASTGLSVGLVRKLLAGLGDRVVWDGGVASLREGG